MAPRKTKRTAVAALAVLLALGLPACDGTVPPDFDELEGVYDGRTTGSGSGWTLTADATLAIRQTGPDLWGTWQADGQWCHDDYGCQRAAWTVEYTGTVAEGRNPTLSLELNDGCGGFDTLAGIYNTNGRRLALSGSLSFLDDDCRLWGAAVVNATLTRR